MNHIFFIDDIQSNCQKLVSDVFGLNQTQSKKQHGDLWVPDELFGQQKYLLVLQLMSELFVNVIWVCLSHYIDV